jgi:hypothetical protein
MLLLSKPALLAAALVLAADSVPTFEVEAFCHRVAALDWPVGDADVCLRKERQARDQLARYWTQFHAADRSYCRELSTTGFDPTYTELLTCLELQRDVRNLRDKDREKMGEPPSPLLHEP